MSEEGKIMRQVAGVSDATGRIITHPPSEAYSAGWERIFGKRCPQCGRRGCDEFPGCFTACGCDECVTPIEVVDREELARRYPIVRPSPESGNE